MSTRAFIVLLLTVLYVGGFGMLWYETNGKIALAVFLIVWAALLQVYNQFQQR